MKGSDEKLSMSNPKDAVEAMTFAVGENEDRYTKHLEAKGALAQSL